MIMTALIGLMAVCISWAQEAPKRKIKVSQVQFSEPGEYIIEVVPSNYSDLVSTTFSVTVGLEDISQQEKTDTEEKKLEGTRPIISQIDDVRIKLPQDLQNKLLVIMDEFRYSSSLSSDFLKLLLFLALLLIP